MSPVRSYVPIDLSREKSDMERRVEELGIGVHVAAIGGMWPPTALALVEVAEAAIEFKEAFFHKALEDKRCCFCGSLKRGYIHDNKCAFVDFVNVPAVTHLKGNKG